MRYIADGKKFSPPSTIEDMSVLEDIKGKMKAENIGQAF
jgi:hypothetical protein